MVCREHTVLLALAAFLAFSGVALGQQPANSNSASQSAPAADPAARPISEAAHSASGQSSTPKPDNTAKADDENLSATKLGVGDLIEVNVYNVPELASKARISNSGDVYLPLIDYVHVDGLTQEEAQALIEKRLSDGGFVRSPHVTIFVDEASSQGVTIIGEVGKPGIYPDTADRKLYEVLSQAGGFNPQASRKISILRKGQPQPIHVDLPRNLADDPSENIEVLPGDTISVPRAPIIYVVGDVGRPSGLLVDNGSLPFCRRLRWPAARTRQRNSEQPA